MDKYNLLFWFFRNDSILHLLGLVDQLYFFLLPLNPLPINRENGGDFKLEPYRINPVLRMEHWLLPVTYFIYGGLLYIGLTLIQHATEDKNFSIKPYINIPKIVDITNPYREWFLTDFFKDKEWFYLFLEACDYS